MNERKTTELLVRLIDEWINFTDNLSEDNGAGTNPKNFMSFYYWLKNIQNSN